MEISSGIIIGSIFCYIACMVITMNVLSDLIKKRDSFSYKSQNIVSVRLSIFIEKNKQNIILYGAWLFPITIGIIFSFLFSSTAYNNILAKSDEDRIIPWLF